LSKPNPIVAVSGATGRQGGAVVRQLLAGGSGVRALTRRPASNEANVLRDLGAEVVLCDLDDEGSVRAAIGGASGVFLTTTPYENGTVAEEHQAQVVIDAAVWAGVAQIVYSSVACADQLTGVPHFESKGRVESRLNRAGFESTTVLRPTLFMEMLLGKAFRRDLAEGQIKFIFEPATSIAMIAVQDIGAFAALAFAHPHELNGRVVDLCGERPSLESLAASMSAALGRSIRYVQVGASDLAPDVSPKIATQRWLEDVGWPSSPTELGDYEVQLTDTETWARLHRRELSLAP
jgi:uncharacterized protein YbjT (DUF2867 family)